MSLSVLYKLFWHNIVTCCDFNGLNVCNFIKRLKNQPVSHLSRINYPVLLKFPKMWKYFGLMRSSVSLNLLPGHDTLAPAPAPVILLAVRTISSQLVTILTEGRLESCIINVSETRVPPQHSKITQDAPWLQYNMLQGDQSWGWEGEVVCYVINILSKGV